MDSAEARRAWRKDRVGKFLGENGVAEDTLAPSTRQYLDEWARQIHIIETQPSANHDAAVLELCKAVESQLAYGLGRIKGLEHLVDIPTLGAKAMWLKRYKPEDAIRQRLEAQALKPGFVFTTLPRLLLDLADYRGETAHGNIEARTVTIEEAEEVRKLAGIILKQLIPSGKA